jgi:hypothetical protein
MLVEVEREFQVRSVNSKEMVAQFGYYIKNIYEEQVFRSVTTKNDALESHREYKKIAKKVRENKEVKSIV